MTDNLHFVFVELVYFNKKWEDIDNDKERFYFYALHEDRLRLGIKNKQAFFSSIGLHYLCPKTTAQTGLPARRPCRRNVRQADGAGALQCDAQGDAGTIH